MGHYPLINKTLITQNCTRLSLDSDIYIYTHINIFVEIKHCFQTNMKKGGSLWGKNKFVSLYTVVFAESDNIELSSANTFGLSMLSPTNMVRLFESLQPFSITQETP